MRAGGGFRRARRALAVLVPVVVILLLTSFPTPGALGTPHFAVGSPAGPVPAARAGATTSASPHPAAISCTGFPEMNWLGNIATYLFNGPMPALSGQTPCAILDPTTPAPGAWHDEVHGTFSSDVAGSGERVEVPVTLPQDTGTGVQGLYTDFNLGMVVTGDAKSTDNQSYAEILFAPNQSAASGYRVVALAWSLYQNTSMANCAGAVGQQLTWNGNYSCERELIGSGAGDVLAKNVAGGSLLNVTFVGSTANGTNLTVYLNDSAASLATSVTYDAALAGSDLHPAFNSSCIDACLLNWSFQTGLSFGADLCYYSTADVPSCNSYDLSALNLTNPAVIGIPHFYQNGAYTGEYRVFAPESISSACSGIGSSYICPITPTLGYYPHYSFNGSALNFGIEKPWATENFGGAQKQFRTAGIQDIEPLWLDEVANSSLAGFIAPASSLTVTARAQVFGSVNSVFLNYTLPDGTNGNISMSRIAGIASDGTYSAVIPSTGGNGQITYRLWLRDTAGSTVENPLFGENLYSVSRGPIPVFNVTIRMNAPSCGGVSLNGSVHHNGDTVALTAGTYPLSAVLCYPYVFNYWSSTRGIELENPTVPATNVSFSASGTITANWQYVRPMDTITFVLSPSGSGTIDFNNSLLTSTTTLQVPDFGNYSLTQSPGSQFSFNGWSVSNTDNLTILGTTLTPRGNGTVTANYIGTLNAVTILFHTLPKSCGGVLIRGVGYTDNETLSLATNTPYPIRQGPCAHYGFDHFTTTTGVSIAGGSITVTEAGIVTEVDYHLTEVTVLTLPGWCGGITWDGITYANGTVLNVTNNTIHTVVPVACSGHYFTGFYVTGGVSVSGNVVTVNGTGILEATFQSGTPHLFVGFITAPSTCGTIIFGGVGYHDTDHTYVAPFTTESVSTVACGGYGFVGWATSGGISISRGIAYLNQSGSITAIFHQLVTLYVATSPSSCGEVEINGVAYSNGATPRFPINLGMPLLALPCTGYYLSAWHNTSDAILYRGTLSLESTAQLTAVFALTRYNITVLVAPASCGGLTVQGREYFNNSTVYLTQGSYALSVQACEGDAITSLATTGNLSLAELNLTVAGPGSVAVGLGPVPPAVALTSTGSAYTGTSLFFQASVGVLVPPFNYNYTWNFGDGSVTTTPANFTAHVYHNAGIYRVEVTVHDPYGRVATNNTTVTLSSPPALSALAFTTADYIVLGVVALVLIAFLLLATRRPGAPPDSGRSAPRAVRAEAEPMALEAGGGTALSHNPQEEPSLAFDAPTAEPSNPNLEDHQP